MRSRRAARVLAVFGASILLAACSATGGTGGPVTLDYWCWGAEQQEKVTAFNKAHPDIQVRHTDAGGGSDTATKLLTASRAGNAPDISCLEYPSIPAMLVADVLADISAHTGAVRDDFTPETWQLTRFDGAVYGIPQDVGPMVLVYNRARFDELGLDVPATWEEFAQVAADVRRKDPDTYLATFSPAEFGNFAGLAQQAGASWWTFDQDSRTWTVGLADDATLEVAGYWQDLIDRDLVKPMPLLTPEWNNQVNRGEILTWPSALWASGVLYGVAEAQAGDWAIAPLPQWTEGDERVAFQGGTALTVTKNSEHPEAAAEFAMWMNTSKTAYDIQIAGSQYPASLEGQAATAGSPPPALVGEQDDYWDVATTAAQNTMPNITWGPNVDTASSAYEDAVATAVREGTSLVDALRATQNAVVEDMERVGFRVAG